MIIETKNYNIYSGGLEVFQQLQAFLNDKNYSKIFILVDENTKEFCFSYIKDYLNHQINFIQIKSGEINKNLETCSIIWNELTKQNADRKSVLINIGGGVIGDMGGFCASTYKRGVDFINIPTTLLSQVDASVGGKLGVDFNGLKNQIGLFNDPKAIFVYHNFVNTLSTTEVISGFAEIIKHGLILDKNYWKEIKNFDKYNLKELPNLINQSISIKRDIVNLDPEEKNVRKKLNFGHTIGHAIESLSVENDINPLSHGESVAIGMICESFLSYKINNLSEIELNEISTFIFSKYNKYKIDINNYDKYLSLMCNDKKNENNKINFTLLNQIGQSDINKYANFDLIIESLDYYRCN